MLFSGWIFSDFTCTCVIKTISPSYSMIDKLVLLCTMNYATTCLTIHLRLESEAVGWLHLAVDSRGVGIYYYRT